MTTEKTTPARRVIGLDSHPDTFAAALLQGQCPAAAVVQKMFGHVPLAQLQGWAKKHTTPEDLFVLEASGNSFQVVRLPAASPNRKTGRNRTGSAKNPNRPQMA